MRQRTLSTCNAVLGVILCATAIQRQGIAQTDQTFQWGQFGDIPVPGHYLGYPGADLAVWRPSDGVWYVKSPFFRYAVEVRQQWGQQGDIPVPGDYDGDGRTDFAVFRPSEARWYVLSSATGVVRTQQLAAKRFYSTDTPVAGDFDGDGRADFATWNSSTGFYVISSGTGAVRTLPLGSSGDIPVIPGRYPGYFQVFVPGQGIWHRIVDDPTQLARDHVLTLGQSGDVPLMTNFFPGACSWARNWIWRPTTGGWNFDNGFPPFVFGQFGDIPVPADYLNLGRDNFAVWRPSDGTWHITDAAPSCRGYL